MLFGAGNGYVKQPPFFFQRAGRVAGHVAGEESFFQPDDKDILEF